MAISALVTKISKEDNDVILNKILYIYYLFHFCQNKKNEIQALINSGNEVNTIKPEYRLELDLKIRYTNIKT